MHQYDVFISHASEDKHGVVRPLAEALRASRVDVWYDEFELRVGSRLRASIDRGLAQSRFGIVVLSESFFEKSWPAWELDGLLQNHLSRSQNVILPVWHGVSRDQVASYSPSLANIVGVDTQAGLDEIVTKLLAVIRPKTSALVVAREICLDFGLDVPVVTDDWWLEVAAFTARNPVEDTFQEATGWGRWGFPLPEKGDSPDERGARLAWSAMTEHWQVAADAQRITQISRPEVVHAFIESMPGLTETCLDFPSYLAAYAPLLTVPGFAGPFEEKMESMYQYSLERSRQQQGGQALTTGGKPPRCSMLMAFRDPSFGGYAPGSLACNFVMGDLMGPEVKAYATIDYCAWLPSSESDWVPTRIHDVLTQGMLDWPVWAKWVDSGLIASSDEDRDSFDRFLEAGERDDRDTMAALMAERLLKSVREIGLPEDSSEIAKRMVDAGFIDAWLQRNADRRAGRRKRKNKNGSN